MALDCCLIVDLTKEWILWSSTLVVLYDLRPFGDGELARVVHMAVKDSFFLKFAKIFIMR